MQGDSELKKRLEHTYDIPFVIESGASQYDPWYLLAPYDEYQSLFSIRLTFRNALRLSMDFEPHKYSANLIRSMGMASPEQKLAFCSYARIINDKGGKIDFTINDQPSDPFNDKLWPDDWITMRLHITLMPISESDDPQSIGYTDLAGEWGCLTMGMILSLLDIVPLDDEISGYEEGNKYEILATRYERNPINRFLCIEHYGYKCQVCEHDFEKTYGEIGHEYIQVHHIKPVSKMGAHYIVEPLKDLIPVCANCHVMLHKKDPPISIEELKSRLRK
jgi:5-methylcytosine-specific restriction protein A